MNKPFGDVRPMFGFPVAPAHKWFAWKPVKTFDGRWIWLRYTWRQRIAKYQHLYGGDDFWFRYAVIT